MEQQIEKLEQIVKKLEAMLENIAWWFTDQPALDNYISPSAVAFRDYLDGLESSDGSSGQTQAPPASTR